MKVRASSGQLSLFESIESACPQYCASSRKSKTHPQLTPYNMAGLNGGLTREKDCYQSGKVLPFPRRNTKPAPNDGTGVLEILGEHIGRRHALLLHLLGYTHLSDLAHAHPAALLSIAGIGERRLEKIHEVLRTQGFAPTPRHPEPSGFETAYLRLKREFGRSP
jgi:hypothetical protein